MVDGVNVRCCGRVLKLKLRSGFGKCWIHRGCSIDLCVEAGSATQRSVTTDYVRKTCIPKSNCAVMWQREHARRMIFQGNNLRCIDSDIIKTNIINRHLMWEEKFSGHSIDRRIPFNINSYNTTASKTSKHLNTEVNSRFSRNLFCWMIRHEVGRKNIAHRC